MCWLDLKDRQPRAFCLYSVASVAFCMLLVMNVCHKVLLFNVYREFHVDDSPSINYFFDKLTEECPEESYSITRSVLNRELHARAQLHPDLRDLVVPLTGFWIFVTIATCGIGMSWSVELLLGSQLKKGGTECIYIWYINSGA